MCVCWGGGGGVLESPGYILCVLVWSGRWSGVKPADKACGKADNTSMPEPYNLSFFSFVFFKESVEGLCIFDVCAHSKKFYIQITMFKLW